MKQKHFIDSHKGATFLWVLGCIWYYEQWHNVTAWVYLGLHGTYGLLWLLKSFAFGDPKWEARTGLGYGLVIWGSLSLYWVSPWIICSFPVQAPAWWIGTCVAVYVFGVFFHFTADMQKSATLAVQRGLITTGLFARCRNPNYFGELLIYLGFSLLAMHWIPLAALSVFVLGFWVPNMIRKDRSLARYPEFEAYRKRSALFIPYLL